MTVRPPPSHLRMCHGKFITEDRGDNSNLVDFVHIDWKKCPFPPILYIYYGTHTTSHAISLSQCKVILQYQNEEERTYAESERAHF
jgi:hypothetical protein